MQYRTGWATSISITAPRPSNWQQKHMPNGRDSLVKQLASLIRTAQSPEGQTMDAEALACQMVERIPFADLVGESPPVEPPPMDVVAKEIYSALAPGEKMEFHHFLRASLSVMRAMGRHLGASRASPRSPRRIGHSPLTPRQMSFLRFIHEKIEATGMFPSNGEIGEKFQIKPNGVPTFLDVLAKKGYVCHGGMRGEWFLTEDAAKVIAAHGTGSGPSSKP